MEQAKNQLSMDQVRAAIEEAGYGTGVTGSKEQTEIKVYGMTCEHCVPSGRRGRQRAVQSQWHDLCQLCAYD